MARTGGSIAGRLCEGHVALRHSPRFTTKAFPGYYQYSNEIALIR